MHKTLWISAALVAASLGSAQAQLVGGVTANPSTAKAGEPVTVAATVDVVSAGNFCGFAVFYGDGKNIESYSDYSKPMPFVTTHVYDKPGTYTISMGGRHVESHPNCGGGDKFATVTILPAAPAAAAAPAAMAKPATAATVCPAPWKLVAKSFSSKTGAYSCSAKGGTALPAPQPQCPGDLTYFENGKKGQFGCRP